MDKLVEKFGELIALQEKAARIIEVEYYYNIDPHTTCFYIQSSRELWDNEENVNNQYTR